MVVAKRDPRVAIAPQYLAQARTTRRPQHRFNLRFLPYEIQPFLLAPVLPGETFDSVMLQSQTWSDPLKPTLKNVGWWLQYNFFYVRHRDLPDAVRTVLAQMLIDPANADLSSITASADNTPLYTFDGGVEWSALCLEHIVSEFFRDEGEDWNVATSAAGLPLASIYGRGSSDGVEKLTLDTDYEDRRVNLIENNALYANDLSTMMGHWAAMRDAGLTEMDYQDFMKTYGSNVREDEESPNLHRAEDLWAIREFTYPSNTVEGTTGVPAVATGWRVQKSGGKRVFCDEPGFIFGVTYVRPKVYMKNMRGSLAGAMADIKSWLPAMLHDQVDLGHVKFDHQTGPMPAGFTGDDDYWLDLRDLFLYGDQFVNHDGTNGPFVNLPAADATRRYVAQSELRSFFATSFASTGVFETDGIASLAIKGRQKNTTSGLVLGRA